MKCNNPNCKSERFIQICGKTSDMCFAFHEPSKTEGNGYVPCGLGFDDGSADYIDFKLCLDCGTIQGKYPISDKKVLKAIENM